MRAVSPRAWAQAVLDGDSRRGLRRAPRSRDGGSRVHALCDGREVVVFSANDYLGLAVRSEVRVAAAAAALDDGVGATGSRHLSGCHHAIAALEDDLADFEGAATATLAPSGYAANVAVLQALGGRDAVVLSDERNHASIVDGCRLSRATVEVYPHGDMDALERRLRAVEDRAIVVSDTVFSMDGTVADVRTLATLTDRHGAWLVLDEAHATGVLGPGGRGAAAEAGIDPRAEHIVRVVTLSKALGAAGGAVCGPVHVRALLLQRGRALIFSTAPAHPVVAAARAALRILRAEPELCDRVRAAAGRVRAALSPVRAGGRDDVPTIPVVVGEACSAVAAELELLGRGYLVQAVRPPSVPPGTSRLRIAVSAAHTDGELDGVAAAVREVVQAAGRG